MTDLRQEWSLLLRAVPSTLIDEMTVLARSGTKSAEAHVNSFGPFQLFHQSGVRRIIANHGGDGVGCDGILQEPGSAARRRYRSQVLCERAEPASGSTPAYSAKGAGKEAKLCHIGHLMMENAMASSSMRG
jgi:hypothetical protein